MENNINIVALISEYEKKISQIEIESKETINRYRQLIEALKRLPEYEAKTSIRNMLQVNTQSISRTLNQKVKEALKEANRPLTSREIMDKVNIYYGDKEYKFNAWSGTFSQMYSKPNSGIQKHHIPNLPVQYSTFYGLSEWFETNGILKKEYLEKIINYHQLDLPL